MIRIDTAADLADMFDGQTEFEVAVYLYGGAGAGDEGGDIVGTGHTVAEAVADARATFKAWREHAAAGGNA